MNDLEDTMTSSMVKNVDWFALRYWLACNVFVQIGIVYWNGTGGAIGVWNVAKTENSVH